MEAVYWTEDILRFRDTDANGHINNTTFSVLCESGRIGLLQGRMAALVGPDAFFVLVRFAVDYRTELHFPGRVRTATWVAAVGNSSIRFGQRVLSEDRLAADAESVCALMDRRARRATPLPDELRRVAESLLLPDGPPATS